MHLQDIITDSGKQRFFKQAEISNFTKEERLDYEESLKIYRDIKNSIDTSFEEGKTEGKLEIARNMLNDGLPVETISKYTGLTVEEIQNLKK